MTEDQMYEQSVHGQLQAALNEVARLRQQLSGVGVQEYRRLEAECERLRNENRRLGRMVTSLRADLAELGHNP